MKFVSYTDMLELTQEFSGSTFARWCTLKLRQKIKGVLNILQ